MFQYKDGASIGPAKSLRCFDLSPTRRKGVYDYLRTQFLLNLGVLCVPRKQSFIPIKTMFQYKNVASIGPAISFRSFDVSLSRRRRRRDGEFHHFYTHFWVNLDIVTCIVKLWIKAFRTYLEVGNVASISPEILVRIFEVWCRRRGRVSFTIFTPNSGSIWMFLHAL